MYFARYAVPQNVDGLIDVLYIDEGNSAFE
jgi:hypothetical protein